MRMRPRASALAISLVGAGDGEVPERPRRRPRPRVRSRGRRSVAGVDDLHRAAREGALALERQPGVEAERGRQPHPGS